MSERFEFGAGVVALGVSLLIWSDAAPALPQYSYIVAANSGQCLSISGASSSSGAKVVQYPCTGLTSQSWRLVPVGSYYHVVVESTGMCLNIPGNNTTQGTQLIQWPCQWAGTLNDQWSLVPTGNAYQLVSRFDNECVNIYGNSQSSGAAVIQWRCVSGAQNEQFTALSAPAPVPATVLSEIAAANSGMCVTGASATGTGIVQTPCSGTPDQEWSFVAVGNYYEVVSSSTNMCLDIPGSSASSGTQLVQDPCQSSPSEEWSLVAAGGGLYQLVSALNGLCVTINGSSRASQAAVVQTSCTGGALGQQFTVYAPALAATVLPSAWSPVIPLSVNSIAVANLPDGTLLMWSAYDEFKYEGDIGFAAGQTYTGIFNPATDTSSQVVVTNTGADMFCPGTARLPDGRVLVNGGSSSPKTSLYSPQTSSWSSDANMNIRRGYEGDTLISTGQVFTLGGSWTGGTTIGKTGELWTSGGGWTVLTGIPETPVVGPDPQGVFRGDNHLWLLASSNGTIFHAGPSAAMHWITTTGQGTITSAGNRGSDPYSINGNASLYDIGMILKVGGAPAYQQQTGTTTYATNSAYLINITAGPGAAPQVQQLPSMNYARAFVSSVVLPDGNVLVVGGQTIPQPFTDTGAVLVPELWDHVAQVFHVLKPMQVPRTYHSTAILLPDGRVFVGGGGQCGAGCVWNHLNAEILSPPYLFNADGTAATRPAQPSAPSSASLGTTFTVTSDNTVTALALMRLSAITHTTNNDQRRIPLQPTALGSGGYSVTLPADPGVLLPGYYMLFALNANGVPSTSTTIQIQ
jgi:hypothetical protein